MIKVAGVVVLYYPTEKDLSNMNTYINDIDKLYVIDNTPDIRHENSFLDFKKVKYIFNGENVGVAAALNTAANCAINDGYLWLLTMDQDSRFEGNSVDVIKKYISNNDMSFIGIVTPWHKTKLKLQKPVEKVDYPLDVMTSGNFVNLDIYKKIGGYKEWLFIDAIDTEFCLNLWSNGYKVLRLNEVEMNHDLGDIFFRKLFGRVFVCTNHNHVRRYYIMRNNHYVRDMYVNYYKEYCELLIKQKENIIKIILFENDKYRKIRETIRGYMDYKKNVKGRYKR